MKDRFTALRVFAQTARSGSFSRAAAILGLSQPSVSRIVAELEADLGVRLFQRSTRALALTHQGADYLQRVGPILDGLAEADAALRGTDLRGRLRVALSTSFGVREVVPHLAAFRARHPELALELLMTDQRQDLVVEGADLALRLGVLPDSSLVARTLAVAPRVLVASPDYVARAGRPATPADIAQHSLMSGPLALGAEGWRFADGGRPVVIRAEPKLVVTANEGLTAAAVQGLGIAQMSLWGCRQELADGRLLRLLAEWEAEPIPLRAVFPAGRAASPAARAFADHIEATLATG